VTTLAVISTASTSVISAYATENGVLTPCSAAIRLYVLNQDCELATAPAGSAALISVRSALISSAVLAWAKV
jgi:hypothetical protein